MTAVVPPSAIVLCAGLGTRLRPLSYVRAKAAVPVAGEALVRRILRWLAGAGVRAVVVNLHHLPHTITREIGDGADLGLAVRYSWEPRILGSGGGPRAAFELLDADRAWIVNGDTLSDVSLEATAAAHARSGALVTLALAAHPAPDRYGGVVIDAEGRVQRFVGPRSGQDARHFVGIQLVERAAYEDVPAGEPLDALRQVYRPLIDRDAGAVRGVVSRASFADIGTPADYLATCGRLAGTGTPLGCGTARLDPTASLEETILWDGVEVGAGATLRRCIVTDGVTVPAGMALSETAILRAADVPEGTGTRFGRDLCLVPLTAPR